MINSFQSILDSIDEHQQSLEWTTNDGTILHGVLYQKNGRLTLNLNPKGLSEAVHFEHLYHTNSMGGKRVVYPHDVRSSKYIPAGRESESWPIDVFMCEDVVNHTVPDMDKITSFTFDSFLLYQVPENRKEQRNYEHLISKVQDIKTSLGDISISLNAEESSSFHPSKFEKRMDKITISVKRATLLSNNELLMWHARFLQLLTLINKERAVSRAVQRGFNNILIPHLVEEYVPANYAFRSFITLEAFVKLMQQVLVGFVDKYDQLATFTEDLTAYYRDYPLDPPDKVQLLRLFTSIEQCANYAQKSERLLNKKLNEEEVIRKNEFDTLLGQVKSDTTISSSVKDYLNNSKRFYITSGSQAAPKHKISELAGLLKKNYGLFTSMTNMKDVELALKMRNVVAHGFYDPSTEERFYANRDRLGQDIEKCLRAYILRTLGAKPQIVKLHSEPLKARQFNIT